MSTTTNGNQRGTQGRPSAAEVLAPKDPTAEKIKSIFRAQAKHLAALFPTDGETMVARACSMALTAAKTVKASPESIAETALACLHLGLEFGDQAYAVPHGGRAALIVGPRGLIALAFRSGFVKSIEARSVFAGDFFEYELGDSPYIRHRKATAGRRPERAADTCNYVTHVYVVIETTTAGKIREVLTAEDLRFYRGFSKANNGPWFDNFEGMARKTAIKRGLEFVPRSALLATALREDNEGNYQIPEDILAAVRAGGTAIPGDTGAPALAPSPTEVETLYADGAAVGREPGSDDK